MATRAGCLCRRNSSEGRGRRKEAGSEVSEDGEEEVVERRGERRVSLWSRRTGAERSGQTCLWHPKLRFPFVDVMDAALHVLVFGCAAHVMCRSVHGRARLRAWAHKSRDGMTRPRERRRESALRRIIIRLIPELRAEQIQKKRNTVKGPDLMVHRSSLICLNYDLTPAKWASGNSTMRFSVEN